MSMDNIVRRLFQNVKEVSEDEWLKVTIGNLKRGYYPRYNYDRLIEYIEAKQYKLYIVDKKLPVIKTYHTINQQTYYKRK